MECLGFINECWQLLSKEQSIREALSSPEIELHYLEADELWSFVGMKDCNELVWIAIERRKRLITRFHIGGMCE